MCRCYKAAFLLLAMSARYLAEFSSVFRHTSQPSHRSIRRAPRAFCGTYPRPNREHRLPPHRTIVRNLRSAMGRCWLRPHFPRPICAHYRPKQLHAVDLSRLQPPTRRNPQATNRGSFCHPERRTNRAVEGLALALRSDAARVRQIATKALARSMRPREMPCRS